MKLDILFLILVIMSIAVIGAIAVVEPNEKDELGYDLRFDNFKSLPRYMYYYRPKAFEFTVENYDNKLINLPYTVTATDLKKTKVLAQNTAIVQGLQTITVPFEAELDESLSGDVKIEVKINNMSIFFWVKAIKAGYCGISYDLSQAFIPDDIKERLEKC